MYPNSLGCLGDYELDKCNLELSEFTRRSFFPKLDNRNNHI